MEPTLITYDILLNIDCVVDCFVVGWLYGAVREVDVKRTNVLLLMLASPTSSLSHWNPNPDHSIVTLLFCCTVKVSTPGLWLLLHEGFACPALGMIPREVFYLHTLVMFPVLSMVLKFWVWNPWSQCLVSVYSVLVMILVVGLCYMLASIMLLISKCLLRCLIVCLAFCCRSWLRGGSTLGSHSAFSQR